jgi:hypothetical protein
MRTTDRLIGVLVVAALTLALTLGVASTAFATPSDTTLGLSALKAMLDASGDGTIFGYFKTVDRGSTIETIPVTIMAITGGTTADSALIMFEATGSKIDKFGGIVAGMSGSPVYVSDGGIDKVVGAVSYGDYFTKGGTGLATPIEAMRLVRATYLPEFVQLTKPLVTTDGLVKSIIIAPTPQDYSVQAKQGAFVARPLSSVFIGGLDPSSPGYGVLAKVLADRGQNVVPLSARLSGSPTVGDQSFETTLVPGAAVAAMEARGDMWIGGVGTVTYTDTDTVLAFGHPAFWAGPTSLYMTNAWIDGVWPSTYEPYKVARPTALRGTITQDRSAGILGVVGQFPAETTMTATAYNVDRSTTATSTVYMSRALLDAGTIDPDFVGGIDPITGALGVYPAGQKLVDAQQSPGSADVTTTVRLTDGTTTYTVTMPNRIDSGYSIPLVAIQDAATAINTLQQVPAGGVHALNLLSIDLTSRITTQRKWARIVDVQLPQGLKVGANPVKVLAIAYGQAATQTIDTTLTVPSGTNLSGSVVAASQAALAETAGWRYGLGYSTSWFDPGVEVFSTGVPSHGSVADAVDSLNSKLPNNVIAVMFVSNSSMDFGSALTSSIMTTVSADWVFSESAASSVTQLSVQATPGTVSYGGGALLTGSLTGPYVGATVAVYATPTGGTEETIGVFPTSEGDGEGLGFEVPVGPLLTTTSFRVHYDGTGGNSSADATIAVGVRARVAVSSSAKSVRSGRSVTLRTAVRPATTGGGQVVFEVKNSGRNWRAITTKTLTGGAFSATAAVSLRVARGTHKVRVRYLGGTFNTASTSAVIVVTGR